MALSLIHICEPQQIFRDARQAVGLLHDVADELAHRGSIDVFGLQNRVGEQADTMIL